MGEHAFQFSGRRPGVRGRRPEKHSCLAGCKWSGLPAYNRKAGTDGNMDFKQFPVVGTAVLTQEGKAVKRDRGIPQPACFIAGEDMPRKPS